MPNLPNGQSEAKLQEEATALRHVLRKVQYDGTMMSQNVVARSSAQSNRRFEQRSRKVLHEQKERARLQQKHAKLELKRDEALDDGKHNEAPIADIHSARPS